MLVTVNCFGKCSAFSKKIQLPIRVAIRVSVAVQAIALYWTRAGVLKLFSPCTTNFLLSASVYHLQFPETLLPFITHAQAQFHMSLEYELTLH